MSILECVNNSLVVPYYPHWQQSDLCHLPSSTCKVKKGDEIQLNKRQTIFFQVSSYIAN